MSISGRSRENTSARLGTQGHPPPRAIPAGDQGDNDGFRKEQLRPELFEAACRDAGQPLTLRLQPRYDHGYGFVQTFIEDHLRHHAQALQG